MIRNYWEPAGHIPEPHRSEFWDGLKTIVLLNAVVFMGFAVFYELVKLCPALKVSAWWSAAGFVSLFGVWLRRKCGRASQ